MPRLVRIDATAPFKLDPAALPPDKPVWICQCGLSQKLPFCDGAHKTARAAEAERPGQLCIYSKDGQRILHARPDDHPADAR
ncbi:MAG: CDGSH iron-sulfur domain-containing protein [Phycisphaeraceae bacterium]|nr:CDGSH iron-sulfur domain-containing protein [Phycisphaeraceae bacterium]